MASHPGALQVHPQLHKACMPRHLIKEQGTSNGLLAFTAYQSM